MYSVRCKDNSLIINKTLWIVVADIEFIKYRNVFFKIYETLNWK